ncbi:hypothetical protein [Pseudonocardia kunmingensis]|uniref:Uncharacterized protein n=1 Tax=Pseudonocardia kunmingensis TaxID=630975 RepID=A0A543D3V4_9PSEU|nr:hypothetical protein [Pseudonocardia kunmingensis]TQM04024.1 hypothetical protein FB558_7053 [Pseudonocardia kunmingensis]TQM14627.1 hypothetical protein FB558_1393 [Pseudonocardia kunmingensis]
MATPVTVNDVLDGHVGLDLECLDRIYLNAYVPNLQVGGQVVSFLTAHLGYPIPSPAIFDKIGTAFRAAVDRFAADEHIPVVRFAKTDRKIDRMGRYLARQAATGRSGVAAIGIAQEFAQVFSPSKKGQGNAVWFSFTKAKRRVSCYYFYLWDDEFGPGFIKVCSYFPYPAKVWINGHEWAKRQATHAGIGYRELSNGFAATDDPARLQAICDRLGPATIEAFVERWLAVLPLPLTEADRAAGYWWELSMRQVEVSRTIVFTQPRHARSFFEALVTDNLDIGRPEQVELIFSRWPTRRGRPSGQQRFSTWLVTQGTQVTVNAAYKHSRIKQYLKDGRALRIETVVNDTADLGCLRRLHHLPELQARARAANRRLLDTERVGQGCVLASPAFERIAHPTRTREGRRAPALRFGDPRVQALAGALCHTLLAVTGITNKSLRALMTGLLVEPNHTNYSISRASYDLTRLRRNGLIERLPGRNLYRLTPDGLAFAIFYSKVHNRVLRPLLATTDAPHAPPPLKAALRTIDTQIDARLAAARLPTTTA